MGPTLLQSALKSAKKRATLFKEEKGFQLHVFSDLLGKFREILIETLAFFL